MHTDLPNARVEFHSGYKGEETPRAIILEGRRLAVRSILSRKRALDRANGLIRDIWRCRLDDGRTVTVELLGPGVCRVSG